MVRSVQIYDLVKRASDFGVVTSAPSLDWARVIERKDEIVRQLEVEYQDLLEISGATWLHGRATLVSQHQVALDDRTVQADRIVLAVGSTVARLPIPGIESAITSDDALEQRELPASVVIIGGGIIALEFAHIWNTAGVKVTILEAGRRILSALDEDVAQELATISRERGIEIVNAALVEKVVPVKGGFVTWVGTRGGTRDIRSSQVLLAAGRVPNTLGIGLESVGVEMRRRAIATNEYLQTSVPSIYAGGDAGGGFGLAPVATYEGRLAARNALLGNVEPVDHGQVPWTVFTRPTVSAVGLTETRARSAVDKVDVFTLPYKAIERAVAEGETEGFVKIVSESTAGRILGAHIIGADSEELIHLFAIAMKGGLSVQQLSELIPVHPSFAEAAIGAAIRSRPVPRRVFASHSPTASQPRPPRAMP